MSNAIIIKPKNIYEVANDVISPKNVIGGISYTVKNDPKLEKREIFDEKVKGGWSKSSSGNFSLDNDWSPGYYKAVYKNNSGDIIGSGLICQKDVNFEIPVLGLSPDIDCYVSYTKYTLNTSTNVWSDAIKINDVLAVPFNPNETDFVDATKCSVNQRPYSYFLTAANSQEIVSSYGVLVNYDTPYAVLENGSTLKFNIFILLDNATTRIGDVSIRLEATTAISSSYKRTIGSGNLYDIPQNPNMSVYSTYGSTNSTDGKIDYFTHYYNAIAKYYKNGRQVCSLLCGVENYYDTDNSLKKDANNADMFGIGDEVIPYIIIDNKECPIAKYKDSTPKHFYVTGVKLIFDGCCMQRITLIEKPLE